MRKYFPIIICIFALAGCKEYQISEDPSLRLSFSKDTLRFDTLFTGQGSATMELMVYNRGANAIEIDRIWMDEGHAFKVNIDGEQDISRLTHLPLYGGDSLYVFVRVADFGEVSSDSPVLTEDKLHFHTTSGHTQEVQLEAYCQDVERIGRNGCGRTEFSSDFTFSSRKPYLVFDTLIVGGKLTIDGGARIYMHNGACIFALGDVSANGSPEAPIRICGDRTDRLFDSVPYSYAGGGWDGIYLQAEKKQNYRFQYVDILSGTTGLYCLSTCKDELPDLRIEGCRIHNHTLYGLVIVSMNATVSNTEISNCASYCVYCSGGKHDFIHSTIASYFGYTNIRIQSVGKEDAAAVYIDNLQKQEPQTNSSFYNCIITGYLGNQLVVATPFDRYYPGTFAGNYLKTDTLRMPHSHANVYWQKSDTTSVFRNNYYKYKEYVYYDFHLDSVSPARGIGDSIASLPYPTDRDGKSRAMRKPDAGCYQFE